MSFTRRPSSMRLGEVFTTAARSRASSMCGQQTVGMASSLCVLDSSKLGQPPEKQMQIPRFARDDTLACLSSRGRRPRDLHVPFGQRQREMIANSVAECFQAAGEEMVGVDRKSTRFNSSHRYI